MSKIYAVAVIDLQHYGFGTKSVELFPNKEMASSFIKRDYLSKCEEMGVKHPFEQSNEDMPHNFSSYYAYIADYYYWDLFEREVHNESKERAKLDSNSNRREFNKNYFLLNKVDLDKSLSQYLTDADENYVLFDRGIVTVWGDRNPVIFGDEMAVINELQEDEFDKDGNLAPYLKVETEQDFIYRHCLSALEDWFKERAKEIGEDDGICHIIWLDETFNDFLPNCTTPDVLGIYNNNEGNGLSFLVSDKDDGCQVFWSIDDFNMNELIKFVRYIEGEKEKLSEKE